MAVELMPNQWELGGVVFGAGCAIEHEPTVQPPGMGRRTEDQPIPGHDGQAPGRDLFEPGVWGFQLYTNKDNLAEARQALRELGMAWRGDAYRKLPGRSTSLRYRIGDDQTFVVYGRPREFDYTLGPESLSGRIPITCNFKVMSELFYADYENYREVSHEEPVAGGFTAPFVPPIVVGQSSDPGHPHLFRVEGPLPTHTRIEFKGPLEDSGLAIDGQPYIDFQTTIPAGVTVTVDARPWVRSVYRSDGAAVAGLLSPRSRMPKMLLDPGEHTATLLGTSSTGAGRAFIYARPAYPTV